MMMDDGVDGDDNYLLASVNIMCVEVDRERICYQRAHYYNIL